MKNTKAIFLIILGAFIMATGFAFAVESETYNRLAANGDPFGSRSAEIAPVTFTAPALARTAPTPPLPAEVKAAAPAAAATPAAAPAPAPKPTFGEKAKKFLAENRSTMILTGLGAYIGFALVGTLAGALTGGIGFFLFFAIAAM